jgi:serine phosphatase RsbU (regulator of sigma subunit)
VGGDWHDAYLLPDGSLAAVIGDVVGHDIRAAATMGQLRGVLRTIDYAVPGSPAESLSRTDEVASGLGLTGIATAILAHIAAPHAPGGAQVTWSNAGHPPPIVIDANGGTTILERRADFMLGIVSRAERHDHSVGLRSGDTLFLYTDGLIERPDRSIDDGLAWLRTQLEGRHALPLDELCDEQLRSASSRHDDIAVLAIRLDQAAAA